MEIQLSTDGGKNYKTLICEPSAIAVFDVLTITELCLGNTYGSVLIAELKDKYYWKLEDCFDTEFEEIPKYLYDALLKHHKEINSSETAAS